MIEETLIPILGIVFTFSWLIIWVYMFYSTRSRVKLALIESGRTAAIFRSRSDRENALKYGVLGVMAGSGILLGHLLNMIGLPREVSMFSMILILTGTGLIGYYTYLSKIERKTKQEREKEIENEYI